MSVRAIRDPIQFSPNHCKISGTIWMGAICVYGIERRRPNMGGTLTTRATRISRKIGECQPSLTDGSPVTG